MSEKNKVEIEIRTWTIVKILLVPIAIYLLYLIKDIIALLFVVLILYAIFSPVVGKWAKKIRRIPAVIALLLIMVAALSAVIYLILPPIINESSLLASNFPKYLDNFSYLKVYIPDIKSSLEALTKSIGGISTGFLSLTASIFGGIITFVTAVVLFIYLLLDDKAPKKLILYLSPEAQKSKIIEMIKKVGYKLGAWFRGQMLLGIIIGVIDLVALSIVGVPYALILAVISGLLEIVPIIGPIISGTLAALVALTVSPLMALIVIIIYILVQQLEGAIIVPNVMKKAVGLSPIIIIISILIGAKIFGIVGALFAVPISAAVSVVISEWPTIKETLKTDE